MGKALDTSYRLQVSKLREKNDFSRKGGGAPALARNSELVLEIRPDIGYGAYIKTFGHKNSPFRGFCFKNGRAKPAPKFYESSIILV